MIADLLDSKARFILSCVRVWHSKKSQFVDQTILGARHPCATKSGPAGLYIHFMTILTRKKIIIINVVMSSTLWYASHSRGIAVMWLSQP